jgi:undecaprenyl-diphosphatase
MAAVAPVPLRLCRALSTQETPYAMPQESSPQRSDIDTTAESNSRLDRMLARLKAWSDHHEKATLLILVLVAAGVWGFIELADEVLEGETAAFDAWLLTAMRTPGDLADPVGPGWLEEMARDFTAMGGVALLAFLSVATCGFLAMRHRYATMVYIVAAVVGGLIISTLLKFSINRARPDLVPHLSIVETPSFPSGHSLMAAVVYLTLGVLMAQTQPNRRLRAYLISLAIVLVLAVGISRVYVGVHWPTDVVSGWLVGASWALLCWYVMLLLQRRGYVPKADDEDLDCAKAITSSRQRESPFGQDDQDVR